MAHRRNRASVWAVRSVGGTRCFQPTPPIRARRTEKVQRPSPKMALTGRSGCWFEDHVVAEGFELVDVLTLDGFGVAVSVVVVGAEVDEVCVRV